MKQLGQTYYQHRYVVGGVKALDFCKTSFYLADSIVFELGLVKFKMAGLYRLSQKKLVTKKSKKFVTKKNNPMLNKLFNYLVLVCF